MLQFRYKLLRTKVAEYSSGLDRDDDEFIFKNQKKTDDDQIWNAAD